MLPPQPIVRHDCELEYEVYTENPYAIMQSHDCGDYVRYDDHVESHKFVDSVEQQAFQSWYNSECLAENWSQASRDAYWEVWKAAIKSREVL